MGSKILDPFTNIANKAIQAASYWGSDVLQSLKELQVGSGNTVMHSDQSGLWLGNDQFASAPFSVDMNGHVNATDVSLFGYIPTGGALTDIGAGNITGTYISNDAITTPKLAANAVTAAKIAALTITANEIAANTITAAKLSVSTLSAIAADVGTLTAGTINGVSINMPNESLGTGSSGKLKWASNARIWGDSSGNIGINGVGGGVYIYAGSNERAVFSSSGQTSIRGGLYVHNDGGSDAGNVNIEGTLRCHGDLIINSDHFKINSTSSEKTVYISGNTNIHSDGITFNNGKTMTVSADKSAILETSKGFRALYCMEAPEVWFMDFCTGKRQLFGDIKYALDPLFREVTVPPYHFMPTMQKGVYQVWGRRVGHNHKRFEKKTREEFRANERFLRMAKPMRA